MLLSIDERFLDILLAKGIARTSIQSFSLWKTVKRLIVNHISILVQLRPVKKYAFCLKMHTFLSVFAKYNSKTEVYVTENESFQKRVTRP